jgi:hypothetical protein
MLQGSVNEAVLDLGGESPEREASFVILGHHTLQLFNILAMGMSIGEVMQVADRISKNGPRSYRRDVYGNSEEEAVAFVDGTSAFYQLFLELPNDATVKIVANQKDSVCNSCAIGDHCSKWSSGDYKWMEAIKRSAGNLGLADTIIETQDKVLRKDKETAVPSLELPASTARAVFSDPEYHSLTFSDPLSRALARSFLKKELRKRQKATHGS